MACQFQREKVARFENVCQLVGHQEPSFGGWSRSRRFSCIKWGVLWHDLVEMNGID